MTSAALAWIGGLPGLAPFAAPQALRREHEGEDPAHAKHDERPDKEMMSAGVGDPAGDADTFPLMWMTGMPNETSDPRSMMMYPDGRSLSSSVPYSQTTKMGRA